MRIEREIFFGFYSVRKLLDSQTLSDSTKLLDFDLTWYPNKKSVDHFNWHRLDELYDLSVSTREKRDIRFLCNQFIHSYVFQHAEADGRLDGFFVCSDYERNEKIYFVPLHHVLATFRIVGKDYPSTVTAIRNPKTGDFDISAK